MLGSLKGRYIDCDASAILLGHGNKLGSNKDVVYFKNLRHPSKSVIHRGDNLTGKGSGDDEEILVNLPAVPEEYEKIVFVANVFRAQERAQHFGMVKNAFIRVVDETNHQEMCRYILSENYKGMTAMIFGEVYRYHQGWKFNAIGQPTRDRSLEELVSRITHG